LQGLIELKFVGSLVVILPISTSSEVTAFLSLGRVFWKWVRGVFRWDFLCAVAVFDFVIFALRVF
jgi:hypothetical protein